MLAFKPINPIFNAQIDKEVAEIVKCRFWCRLPLFYYICGAPMQIMKISDFPIYLFTNDLLLSSLYDLVFMKGPNCAQ